MYAYKPPEGRPHSSPPDDRPLFGAPTMPKPPKPKPFRLTGVEWSQVMKKSQASAHRKAVASAARRNKTETGGKWMTLGQLAEFGGGYSRQWARSQINKHGWRTVQVAHRHRIILVPYDYLCKHAPDLAPAAPPSSPVRRGLWQRIKRLFGR